MTTDPFRRLRAELHDASARVRLAPGAEQATIRSAHRRRQRRRAVVGATAAVAVGAGTVVAIQQLGKTGPGGITVGNTGTSLVDQPFDVPPVTGSDVTTTIVGAGLPGIDAQPAVLVESRYTWNVLTPDAAATLGPWHGRVPGVVIATAPGAAAGPDPAPSSRAYYTADGVTFEALDIEPSAVLAPGRRMYADGDSIYRVGTAPGVAADAANPMLVEVSADRGATWSTVELPLDTHALGSLPFVVPSFVTNAVPTDAGVLIVVTERVDWDYREMVAGFEYWEPHQDGVVAGNAPCGPVATTMPFAATTTLDTPAGTTVPAGSAPSHAIPESCTTRLHTWAELGVPQESVDAVGDQLSTTSLFLLVGGEPVELAYPEGIASVWIDDYRGGIYGSAAGDGEEARLWQLTLRADGTWDSAEMPQPLAMSGGQLQTSATRRFTMLAPQGLGGNVLGSTSGADWAFTDLASLHADDPHALVDATSSAATDDGFAVVLAVRTDEVAAAGGRSVTAGALTVSRTGVNSPLVFTDTATGQVVEGVSERWATGPTTPNGPGQVDFVGPDGAVLGSLSSADYEALFAGGYDEFPEWQIVTTADGVNVAGESVAGLVGVADTDISAVRVNSVGRQVIVSVVLTSESSPGVREQRILVGTPND